MKDQQSYFEKADFQSNLPKQFLQIIEQSLRQSLDFDH